MVSVMCVQGRGNEEIYCKQKKQWTNKHVLLCYQVQKHTLSRYFRNTCKRSFLTKFIPISECFVVCFVLVWFGLVWFGLVWFGLVWFVLFGLFCFVLFCFVVLLCLKLYIMLFVNFLMAFVANVYVFT